jgi:hypothetical protein
VANDDIIKNQPADEEYTIEGALAAAIMQSAPHLTAGPALHIANFVMQEQEQLQAFLGLQSPDNPACREYADWVVQLEGPDGGKGSFHGPKQPGSSKDPMAVLAHIGVLGVVTSPLLRGVLRAYGFKYHFAQMRGKDQKIVIPH